MKLTWADIFGDSSTGEKYLFQSNFHGAVGTHGMIQRVTDIPDYWIVTIWDKRDHSLTSLKPDRSSPGFPTAEAAKWAVEQWLRD